MPISFSLLESRARFVAAVIIGGFAIHGALAACSAGAGGGTPSAMAASDGGASTSRGGSSGGASGTRVELNAKDEQTQTPPGSLKLAGRAGIPDDATAVYLQIQVPDGGGKCWGDWSIGGESVGVARRLPEGENAVYHVWVPLDSTQTLEVTSTYADGCEPTLGVEVLGWTAP